MTLDLTRIGAPLALPPAAQARDEAASPAAHAERVTLSAAGREASGAAAPMPSGSVRWYRAPRRPQPGEASAPAAPPEAGRPVHAGVAAYRRTLATTALS